MAVAHLNVALESIRGKCGNLLFRLYGRKLRVIPLPDYSGRRRSKRQKASSRKFAKAVHYAGDVLADPVRLAAYKKRTRLRRAKLREFIIADYMKSGPF